MLTGALILGFIHITAAIILVGGSFFMNAVWGPTSKDLDQATVGKVGELLGRRFTTVAWAAIFALLATGLVRAFGSGFLTPSTLLASAYGQVIVLKIVFFLVGTAVSASIASNSRKIASLSKEEPPPVDEIQSVRSRIMGLSALALLVSLVIVFLGVLLRFI